MRAFKGVAFDEGLVVYIYGVTSSTSSFRSFYVGRILTFVGDDFINALNKDAYLIPTLVELAKVACKERNVRIISDVYDFFVTEV